MKSAPDPFSSDSTDTATKAGSEPDTNDASTAEPDTDVDTEPDIESEPADTSEPAPEPAPEPEPEPETESEPEPESEPEADPTDNSSDSDTEHGESTPEGEPTPEADGTADTDTNGHLTAEVDAADLKDFFEIPNQLLDEGVVQITSEGFTLKKQDKANVALSESVLNAGGFTQYDGDGLSLGIDIERAVDIVGQFNSGDAVSLSLSENRRLVYSDDTIEFKQALIDPDAIASPPDLPEFNNHTDFTVTVEFIKRAVKATDMVADYLTIQTTDGGLAIEATGDTDDVTLEADGDDLISTPDKEASVMLSMDYMKDLKKAFRGDTVTLEVDDNQPVIFRGEYNDSDGTYMHMLAPRIQEQ